MKKNRERRMVMPTVGPTKIRAMIPRSLWGEMVVIPAQSRSRGSMANWIRSTMKYRITYMTAATITTPRTAS